VNTNTSTLSADDLPRLPSAAVFGGGKTDDDGNLEFGVIIQAIASDAHTNLLSTPSIMTLDNQEAEIIVGQNVPLRTGSLSNDSGGNNPFTTIERSDIGVTLKVKPQINDGDSIRLEVSQTAENLTSTVPIGANGASDLVTNKRSITTVIQADDGDIIVLGGLIRDDVIKSETKVPLLGDIPIIGALFRNRTENVVKNNLLVFLKPTILREKASASKLSEEKYQELYDVLLGGELAEKQPKANLQEVFKIRSGDVSGE